MPQRETAGMLRLEDFHLFSAGGQGILGAVSDRPR